MLRRTRPKHGTRWPTRSRLWAAAPAATRTPPPPPQLSKPCAAGTEHANAPVWQPGPILDRAPPIGQSGQRTTPMSWKRLRGCVAACDCLAHAFSFQALQLCTVYIETAICAQAARDAWWCLLSNCNESTVRTHRRDSAATLGVQRPLPQTPHPREPNPKRLAGSAPGQRAQLGLFVACVTRRAGHGGQGGQRVRAAPGRVGV